MRQLPHRGRQQLLVALNILHLELESALNEGPNDEAIEVNGRDGVFGSAR
jgi:hypothetical protein